MKYIYNQGSRNIYWLICQAFFEKIYKIDKNRKKLKIGIDNCPGICYYLQVVMRRKFIRYAEVSELADEQD